MNNSKRQILELARSSDTVCVESLMSALGMPLVTARQYLSSLAGEKELLRAEIERKLGNSCMEAAMA